MDHCVINHCAQIVKGLRRTDHVTPMLRELKWPSVDDLVTERDIAIMHWLLFHEQSPASLRGRVLYRGDVSARETRATEASQLQLPRVRTEQARKFFFYRAADEWNRAPAMVGEVRTALGSRRAARKWLM